MAFLLPGGAGTMALPSVEVMLRGMGSTGDAGGGEANLSEACPGCSHHCSANVIPGCPVPAANGGASHLML